MPNQQFEERQPVSQGESGTTPHELTMEELFNTLQDERRRLALRYLLDAEGPVDADALAEQVAVWEHRTPPADLSTEQFQRVHLDLYQSHLPKFEQLGLITYDQSRGVIESTDMVDLFEPHLDVPSPDAVRGDRVTESETDTDGIQHSLGSVGIWHSLGSIDVSAALVGLAWLALLPALVVTLGPVTGAVAAIPVVVMAMLVATHRSQNAVNRSSAR